MTCTSTTAPWPARRVAASAPPARMRLAQLLTRLLAWHARYRERRTLAELNDHLLRDIGLTPADVRREVAKPFWLG